MFQYHPALMRALEQDRYHRLINERRRCTTNDRPERNVRAEKKAR